MKTGLWIVSIIAFLLLVTGVVMFIKLRKEKAKTALSNGNTGSSTTTSTTTASTSNGTVSIPAGTTVVTTPTGKKFLALN